MARKAELTLDGRLLRTMGRTLYQGSQLFVIPRELLQNAIDAVRMKFGDAPGGEIVVYINIPERIIEVTDNGIGMSDDEIADYFLRLGASGKMGQQSAIVGRFGIAKAAILSCEEWRLETGKYLLTNEILTEKGEIQEVPESQAREGTFIRCRIDDTWRSNLSKTQAILTVGLTNTENISVKLVFVDSDQNDRRQLLDPKELVASLSMEEKIDGDIRYTVIPAFTVCGYRINGFDFIRVHGQVQVIQRNTADRPINLLFDLYPTVAPDHEDYPLTMSREKLKDTNQMAMAIEALIHRQNVDLLTSANAAKEAAQKRELDSRTTKKVVGGRLLRGENQPSGLIRPTQYSEDIVSFKIGEREIKVMPVEVRYDEEENRLYVVTEDGEEMDLVDADTIRHHPDRHYTANFDGNTYYLRNPEDMLAFRAKMATVKTDDNKVRILKYYYAIPDTRTLIWHAKVIQAWQEICKLACVDEMFGVGITSLDTKKASRIEENGIPYYIINPVVAGIREDAVPAVNVLKLWALATHEAGHAIRDVHDELFSNAWTSMLAASAEALWDRLYPIAKLLK